jgi:hypothetical protein
MSLIDIGHNWAPLWHAEGHQEAVLVGRGEAFDLIADTGAGRIDGTGYSQLRNDREPDP